MPTSQEILRDKTFQDADTLDARIYYTLTMDQDGKQLSPEIVTHQMVRFFAMLTAELKRRGVFDVQSIDEILLSVVRSPAGTRLASALVPNTIHYFKEESTCPS